MIVANSVTDLIGNTPLLLLKNPEGVSGFVKIYGKLEGVNPGNSVKDRTALGLIVAAEENGSIRPGYTVVESTSGNLGILLP
jgi:cysteine synthase